MHYISPWSPCTGGGRGRTKDRARLGAEGQQPDFNFLACFLFALLTLILDVGGNIGEAMQNLEVVQGLQSWGGPMTGARSHALLLLPWLGEA